MASFTETNNSTDYAFIHIAKRKISVEQLINQLYNQSSQETIRYFQLLNSHLKDGYVLPGQAVIIAPPKGNECSAFELELMASVNRIEQKRNHLAQDKREVLGRYYGLIDNVAQHGGMAYGLSVGYFSNHAKSVTSILKEIEQTYVQQYNQQGHFNNQRFFVRRNHLFKELEAILNNMVGKSLAGPNINHHNLRNSLNLSSKSILHKLKAQGGLPIEKIPDFEANYSKVTNLSKSLKHAGHFGIALDVGQSSVRIHRACTVDVDKNQCGRTGFKETGRVAGNVAGGFAGSAIAFITCNLVFGLPSAGSSLLWCGIIVGASSGYVASNKASGYFEKKGEVLYETLITLKD
jgi:hypothetical protein